MGIAISFGAYSLAWTNNHKRQVQDILSVEQSSQTDSLYEKLHTATYRATTRVAYLGILKGSARRTGPTPTTSARSAESVGGLTILDFSELVQNAEMAGLIQSRANEVVETLDKAPLGASIMMGVCA